MCMCIVCRDSGNTRIKEMKATTNAARKNGMREQKEVKEETYMS